MYALIHDSQLILGPIGYNCRLINSDLEELEIENRISPTDYYNIPLQIDDKTHLVEVIQIIPDYDLRFESVGNFEWEIIKENDIPVRVEMRYSIQKKSLELIKEEYKKQLAPIRKTKENTYINIDIKGTTVSVLTSREERLSFVSKLLSSTDIHNFKFPNEIWLEITSEDIQYIISQIDLTVQEAFDWEHQKLQEIDACTTGEEVYNVILIEKSQQIEELNALPSRNKF